MQPEERSMFERSLKMAEENNRLLKKMDRRARLAMIWGLIKIAIIAIPLILGYLYLEPYINEAINNYQSLKEVFTLPR